MSGWTRRGWLALLAFAVPAAAGAIPVSEYRGRLLGIEASLRAGDWVGAKLAARRLLGERIAWAGEELAPDASVLGPVAAAGDPRGAGEAARRLAFLAEQLAPGSPAGADAPDPPDAAAEKRQLERARARQALADLPAGGALPGARPLPEGPIEALAELLRPLRDAAVELLGRLRDWLRKLFRPDEPGSGLDLPALATGLAVAVAAGLAALGIVALRRRGRPAASPAAEPGGGLARPAADADPLSREANEWERYARELAAAGRTREAVRAWYHAVLVALYRAGLLHYRKGRTNWEYVSALSPALGWRPEFAEMTRRFEREWYGRDESAPEALREAAALAAELLATVRRAA